VDHHHPRPLSPPRDGAISFVRGSRDELRKVAWPTRHDTLAAAGVVLVAVVLLTALILGLDTVFGGGVLRLLGAD
jgi:preprotein translocase subunit SecE